MANQTQNNSRLDTYNSLDVAQKFVDIAKSQGRNLTPMQVLKLTYIAHGWRLAIEEKPLINEEVEAWKFGPVISSLYHSIKHYRDSPVEFVIRKRNEILTDSVSDFVRSVYEGYKDFDGFELSGITHEEGTAWAKAKQKGDLFLSDVDTKEYYTHLMELNKENGYT